MQRIISVLAPALLILSSCTYLSQGVIVNADRYAETTAEDEFGDTTEKVVYLDQNWDRYDSLWFYFTTQGSDFLPYEVFLNLEQAGSEELLRSSANMNNYRFLNQQTSFDNPDGLPVGFVEDSYQGKNYVGFTCAACHTTQINFQGTGIRIDGGPALADFQSFFIGTTNAIKATLDNPAKFERLATTLIDSGYTESKAVFREELQEILRERQRYDNVNAPRHGNSRVAYGYGRLDAFGAIFNRILEHLTPDDPANFNPANAPVSYPFLWDTPQHDFVQWNGVANNNPGGLLGFLGPLGRNTGEVLGVFATFDLNKRKGDIGYRSSAVTRNLLRLEDHLITLESPVWPEDILPPIDQALAGQGKQLFIDYQCYLCHDRPETFDRTSSERRVIAQFSSLDLIKTDTLMALNALSYQGKSGFFKDEQLPDSKQVFGETTPVVFALKKAGAGVILEPDHDKFFLRRWIEQSYDFLIASFNNPIKSTERHVDFEINEDFPNNLKTYKGRPLNGIWATAPYLHNGSVPNLYELLLPSCSNTEIATGKKCRSNLFSVGSREFDPVKVGLVSKDRSAYPGLYEFDTSLPSNGNAGHEYAAGKTPVIKLYGNGQPLRKPDGQFELEWLPPINDKQRQALVEYLKTL